MDIYELLTRNRLAEVIVIVSLMTGCGPVPAGGPEGTPRPAATSPVDGPAGPDAGEVAPGDAGAQGPAPARDGSTLQDAGVQQDAAAATCDYPVATAPTSDTNTGCTLGGSSGAYATACAAQYPYEYVCSTGRPPAAAGKCVVAPGANGEVFLCVAASCTLWTAGAAGCPSGSPRLYDCEYSQTAGLPSGCSLSTRFTSTDATYCCP